MVASQLINNIINNITFCLVSKWRSQPDPRHNFRQALEVYHTAAFCLDGYMPVWDQKALWQDICWASRQRKEKTEREGRADGRRKHLVKRDTEQRPENKKGECLQAVGVYKSKCVCVERSCGCVCMTDEGRVCASWRPGISQQLKCDLKALTHSWLWCCREEHPGHVFTASEIRTDGAQTLSLPA